MEKSLCGCSFGKKIVSFAQIGQSARNIWQNLQQPIDIQSPIEGRLRGK
jgi:hypothetical protein